MTTETWKRDEPDSPCQNICVIHPASGLCMGCLRTAQEISRWPTMAPQDRSELLAALPTRADRIKPQRRKRGK